VSIYGIGTPTILKSKSVDQHERGRIGHVVGFETEDGLLSGRLEINCPDLEAKFTDLSRLLSEVVLNKAALEQKGWKFSEFLESIGAHNAVILDIIIDAAKSEHR